MTWSAYSTPAAVFVQSSLACFGAGEQSGRFTMMRERALPTHGLVVISHGRGTYSGRGRTIAVRAPALLWLFPGAGHRYGPDDAGWSEHWLLFSGSTCTVLDHLHLWDPVAPLVALSTLPSGLATTFSRLRTALADPSTFGQYAVSVMCQHLLLTALMAAEGSPDQVAGPHRILAEFTAQAMTPMSMSDRARQLGVTSAALRLTIKAATGRTPHDYLLQVRLSEAQVLLAETEKTVAAVARNVGFDDPAYFSRYFTRRVGLSPTAFRRARWRVREDVSLGPR